MRTGNKFTMKPVNDETTSALFSQLAGILGVGKRSDGRYHLADIATAGSINPWAKKKGFGYNSENFDYDPQNPDASNARRAAARRSVNQGFDLTNAKISNTVDVTGIALKYAGDEFNGWVYQHPRGASYNEPNRMRDFDGYNHAALPFIGGWSAPNRIAKDVNTQISVTFVVPLEESDSLIYKDFPIIENSYIGVAFVASNGDTQRLTATAPIKSAGISVELPSAGLNEGTYQVYPFLSSVRMNTNDGNMIAPANVYTLPVVKGRTMVVANKAIEIDVTSYYSGATRLTYTITITNNSLGEMTMSGNEVRHRLSGKSWDDTMTTNETRLEGVPANFTIQGGEVKKITGTMTVKTSVVAGMQFMVQLNGNSNYRASRPVDQTIQGQ